MISGKQQELELLSPARDSEAGKLAINSGADAVYIGAGKFGARAAAGNSLGDIEKLCTYSHLFKAKTYVALNTILFDNELEEARKLIYQVYDAGADAIIIQDMGILEMQLPPIPLFASTQTNNYSPEKIKFLGELGFSRIILARELSLEQIAGARKQTSVELEAFIHGALCVSLSGQCYFSQAIAGRSANRGQCVQACRMPFSLADSSGRVILKDRHLLSLKDFNASARFAQLVDAGVTSFKIEGRLKDNAYVANTTAYYRQLIDLYLEGNPGFKKASSGFSRLSFTPDPEKSFNRGFTGYFLEGRVPSMASFGSPKSTGKPVGEVRQVSENSFTLVSEIQINPGDGLCFFDSENQLRGFNVNRVEGETVFPAKKISIKPGTILYRNFDLRFNKTLENNPATRKIRVHLELAETSGGFCLKAVDEDFFEVQVESLCEKNEAKTPGKALETIKNQLSKTGESVFEVAGIQTCFEKIPFLSLASLNGLRRAFAEKLTEKRLSGYVRKTGGISSEKKQYPITGEGYKANVANRLARNFYTKHGVLQPENGFELLPKQEYPGKAVMTTRYCLKYELGICPVKQKPSTQYGEIKEPLFFADNRRKYRLGFNCSECLMQVLWDE